MIWLTEINLEVSTISGYAPLTVGFYLHDPRITIKDKKMWYFGEENPKSPVYDLVCNHIYSTPGEYIARVDIVELVSGGTYNVIASSKSIKISVTQGPSEINFLQTQGVIYENDIAGFSIGLGVVQGKPIKWTWGDENASAGRSHRRIGDEDLYIQNPFHKYLVARFQSYVGSVTVTWYDNNGKKHEPVWPFAMLVLPSPLRLTGYLEFHSIPCDPPSEPCDVIQTGIRVDMRAQVGSGIPPFTHKWNFGDKPDPSIPNSPQVYHTYNKHQNWRGGDNYLVTDTVWSIEHTPAGDVYVGHTLQKTIAIRDTLP